MASQFLRATLDSWRAGNHAFAVLHAGVGCEHILKALLCRHDPLLISEKGDQSLRFHSLGFGNAQGVKPLSEAKTIGIVEAFRTATIVMNGRMPIDERTFRPFADSRNGVAHSAYLNDQGVREVVELGLAVVEAVRAELRLDSTAFWGEYETVFPDLSQVAAMPASTAQADRPALEAAAEELALAQRAAACSVLSTAMTTAVEAASRESATRLGDHQGDVDRTALNTALATGLRIAGARARQAAATLLSEYGVLPSPARPDTSLTEPGIAHRAHTAVTVKVVIASSVITGLLDTRLLHPELPIIPSLIHLDISGWLRSSQADGDRAWWRDCPACGYAGNVYGNLSTWECPWVKSGDECDTHPDGVIDIGTIASFSCPFCGLLLNDDEELAAAGIESNETGEHDW
ncbi:hypothetical protein [Streptomyces sp. NPDC058424]|uniref:hypothetical protein n=1 Tax=Streptomyces sp. NPDC058424 TaxID=3346491 RepID=UPI00366580A2